MKKKMLVFGVVPFSKGGNKKHGLATGLFDLQNAISKTNKIEVILAPIDLRKRNNIDGLRVLYWDYWLLFLYLIFHIYKLPLYFYQLQKIRTISKTEKPLKILFKVLFFEYAIRKTKPDIIHFHGCLDGVLSCFLRSSAKRVLRIHGINGNDENINQYKELHKLENYVTKNSNFDLVTYISNDNINEWHKLYGPFSCNEKVFLNGYDPKTFYVIDNNKNKSNNELFLLTVGSLMKRKGQIKVLQALTKLQNRSFKYIIVGNNYENDNESYLEIIIKHRLNVEILDFVNQQKLAGFYSNADFFILPSSSEGFGKVFIESIACGIPVIIPANLPLAKEAGVLNEINAVFLKNSSTSAIYDALSVLKKKIYSKEEIANTVNHLTWESIAKEYVQSILEV